MAITIEPYRPEHEPEVRAFNDRLRAAQPDPNLVFFERAAPRWLPKTGDGDLHNDYFLALEHGTVRGGYALKWQNFLCPDGQVRPVGYYHHPLSEGVVSRSYATVGALLLKDAVNRSPLLYCLGMGGYDRPLPKMLIGLGWSHCPIPFYFRVVHPSRFLRELQVLRTSALRRLLMDIGAFSGAGWLAWKAWQTASAWRSRSPQDAVAIQPQQEFADWADALWQESKPVYAWTAVRDSRTLRRLYPASVDHLSYLRVSRNGTDVGWAVVGERRRDAKYGAMRVGSIVDCWASPGHEPLVVRSATGALEQQGADVIFTNQSHHDWCRAVEAHGFIGTTSNFIFAASRRLAEVLRPFEATAARMHLTRADGDGLPDNF